MDSRPPRSGHDPSSGSHDVVIGRALRWSLALFALTGLLGGIVWLVVTRSPVSPMRTTPVTAPQPAPDLTAAIPSASFTDITRDAGIHFVHNNGAYGDKLLPETMGGGVAFFDFENDGDQDLLFVNSTYWPSRTPAGKRPTTSVLYRNDTLSRGSVKFTDITAGSGLDISIYGMGVAVGDYDNDGRVDVFLTGLGGNRLFHNESAGKFKDVTAQGGVGGWPSEWSTSAAFIDYDNDGDLDLFVCNYVRWSREVDFEVDYRLGGIGRAYGPPWNFPGSFPSLYRNEGGGRFVDVSRESGVQIQNPATGLPTAKSLGVAPVDINQDGWIDLVVANDTVQNFVFSNRWNGTFAEIGARAGIAFDSYGQTRGAMGIDAARFHDDNTLAIAIGNFANEMTALYVSRKDALLFADEAIVQGIGPASRQSLTFGVFFFDYDLDGWLDFLSANGHLEEEVHKVQEQQQYRQPAQLFWNGRGLRQTAGFVPVPPAKAGNAIFQPIVGRGSAFGDVDSDGDLDVVLTQIGGPPLLLRNDQRLGHHWLRFNLVGTRSNRDAIGAWVKVRGNHQTLWRQVMPTRGYLSQSELAVTFGLGKNDRVEDVTVFWPGGSQQRIESPRLDSVNRVEQSPR